MLNRNVNPVWHLQSFYNSQDHTINHIIKKENVTLMWYHQSLQLFSSQIDM